MTHLYIILALVLINLVNSNDIQNWVPGRLMLNGRVYLVEETTTRFKIRSESELNLDSLFIQQSCPGGFKSLVPYEIDSKKILCDIFFEVLGTERSALLEDERTIFLLFYFNGSGEILDITFYIDKKTVLEPMDLCHIDNLIRERVSFNILEECLKSAKAIKISYPLNFKTIL